MQCLPSAFVTVALSCLAGPALMAQLSLRADKDCLAIGDSLALCATWSGAGSLPPLDWSLAPGCPGLLTPGEPGQATYSLPFLLESQEVTICVRAAVPTRPGSAVAQASCRFQAQHPAADRERLPASEPSRVREPHLGLLAGSATERGFVMGQGDQARFYHLSSLAYAGDHPDLDRAVRDKWLVLDSLLGHVAVLGRDGRCSPWVGGRQPVSIFDPPFLTQANGPAAKARFLNPSAIAVRPGGAGTPWQAAIADTDNRRICLLDGWGNVSTLAGDRLSRPACWPLPMDGPVQDATFIRPVGVAYGLDGALYVADGCALRKIHGSQVTTLAGSREDSGGVMQDGQGSEARFGYLRGLALDPRTGNLLVTDRDSLRQVTPEGVVTTLAGGSQPGFQRWQGQELKTGKADAMRGVRCLRSPDGLLVAGGKAYIADYGNAAVRSLDLDTGVLKTLVGIGTGRERPTFLAGRLSAGKALPGDACPRILNPTCLAMDPEGHVLVGMTDLLAGGTLVAELVLDPEDLPRLPAGAARPSPGDGNDQVAARVPGGAAGKAAAGEERKDSVRPARLAKEGPAGS